MLRNLSAAARQKLQEGGSAYSRIFPEFFLFRGVNIRRNDRYFLKHFFRFAGGQFSPEYPSASNLSPYTCFIVLASFNTKKASESFTLM